MDTCQVRASCWAEGVLIMARAAAWFVVLGVFLVVGLGKCAPGGSTEPPAQEPALTDSGPTPETSPETQPDGTKPIEKPPLHTGALIDQVDPFIGTGGIGFAVGSSLPGATAPFGMVKISPDTASQERGLGFQHCAGYYYLDTEIFGFSHIHLHGTGVPDYGNLLVMPITGDFDDSILNNTGYRSTFDHASEKASPGYYKVTLNKWKTTVELTATTRTAHHRYTFDPGETKRAVLLRLDHSLPGGSVSEGEVKIIDDKTIEGWLHSNGNMSKRGGGFDLFFVLKSKQAFQGGTWKDGKLMLDQKTQKGVKIGAVMKFDGSSEAVVEFQVGISFVSIEGARKNLGAEQPKFDFEGTKKATEQAWEKLLSVIKVAGGTKQERRIFYTSLYHAFQMPTLFTDVDGQYTGFDKKVHTAKDFTYYTDFSLWDTYRTLHPLLVWLTPKRTTDMIRSLLTMAKQGGSLPRWPLATGYTSTMIGASADIVIADAYLKGLKDYDINFAYEQMKRLAMKPNPPGAKFGGRGGIEHYITKGFVDANQHAGSASMTMEYAYNDYAIAQLAKALGKTEDADTFYKRSTHYSNNWDSKTQFFRGKRTDGTWLGDFNPLIWTKDYVEGTAWQYLWFVPHDPQGLAKLFGSEQALFQKLDEFFKLSKEEHDQNPRPLSSRKYYWHGNEPDLHAALLYTQLGRPKEGQKWVRWIMKSKYDDTPAGLPGNDDCGTLSAWYIFNAVGLYPVPAQDIYLISSPIFTRAQVQVAGKTIEIIAPKASEKAIYVKRALLNGKELPHPWLKHTDLNKDGNTLFLEMTE